MNGPAVSHACPPRDDLEHFCRGDLSTDRLEELAEHLEGCGNCQALLERFTDEADELLTELRRIPVVDQPDSEPFNNELGGDMASLESSAAMLFADTIEERRASPAITEPIPQRLNEYAILEPIGSGGMGAVYRAVHTRLDKLVAIKVLPPQRLSDAAAASRFQREMKAVGKLNHPNIVSATDAGEFDGAAYLVMELVEGMDLARLIERQGRLHVAEACELVRQAALGLNYAHSHGLVHRDVKPSNLLLTLAPEQPSGGLVKLADLGLALLGDIESEHAGQATSANLMIGSLDYMAPEQADDAHRVDQRADLYSLGCTLYELLSGMPPFAGPGHQTRLQKMKAHADAAVPSLAAVCPNLPAGLDAIMRRLLAKDPAARFSSAAEVATALTPFASGANLGRLLDPTSPAVPLPRLSASHSAPPRRRRSKGIVLGCVGALIAASVIYVQTDRGTLEIKSDDDEVKVRVEQDGKLITLVDLKSNKEIRLRSGTYQVALGDADQDLALDADEFTLHRGGKEVVHIRRQPPTLMKMPFDADEAKRHQERWAHFRAVPLTTKSESGMMLTLIPPGEFEMRPGYRVKISKPYYLGTYEVTVGQFRQFAEASGHKSLLEGEGRGVIDLGTFKEIPGMNWRNAELARGDDHPVAGVTWFDAEQFCKWLSERENKKYYLPSEAQWEWAARSGTSSMYRSGDNADRIGDYEWYEGNSNRQTHPVGQKPANAWGLYDTTGNVVEWCQDWAKDPYPQGDVSDPTGPAETGTRTLKGGSYIDSASPFIGRGVFGPASSMIHCGFRVCREL